MKLKERIEALSKDDNDINVVNKSDRMGWGNASIVFIGMWFSMWAVTIGFTMGRSMAFGQACLACIVGFAITAVYMIFVGVVGCRESLPTVVIINKFSGRALSVIFSIATFIVYAWGVGMQADIAGQALGTAMGLKSWHLVSAILAAIMAVSALIGIKGIRRVSKVVVPIFLGFTIIAAIVAVNKFGGLQAVMSVEVEHTMPFAAAVTSACGAWISFATMAPDVTRHIKAPKDVAIATIISFTIGVLLPLIGVALAIVTDVTDMGQVFAAIGLAWMGVIATFFAAWTTNDNNSYTGGIALSNLTGLSRGKATMIVSGIGIILAFLGSGASNVISASLGWMSASACPAGAIIICHYYLFCGYGKNKIKVRGWVGAVAFICGLLLALMGSGQILQVWENIPSFVLGFVGSFLIYLVLGKVDIAMTKAQPEPREIGQEW